MSMTSPTRESHASLLLNIMPRFDFVDPTPTPDSYRKYDKSFSLTQIKNKDTMSYRPTELPTISRHLSENNAAPVKQNYEDLVSCSVCYDVFDNGNQSKLPKILPCQHTYCVECIRTLIHCSNDRSSFSCPQCKYKVDQLHDVADLPTSRVVLALLEKDSLNYQGYASCPSCRQIRSLEVCFECNLPLCVQCVSKHFESWKSEITHNCLQTEESLEEYKSRMDQINQLVVQNFEKVQSIKSEIEDAFNVLFQRLNTEKDLLLKSVDEIKDENTKYVNFKKEVATLIAGFKVFRENNEGYEKKNMNSRMKKCQQNFEQAQKVEKEFASLASSRFKFLERFDRSQWPDLSTNISGSILINEMSLEPISEHQLRQQPRQQSSGSYMSSGSGSSRTASISNKSQAPQLQPPASSRLVSIREDPRVNMSNTPQTMRLSSTTASSSSAANNRNTVSSSGGTASTANNSLTNLNSANLSKWVAVSQIKPQSQMTISNLPCFMQSNGNILFCMDSTSFLSVYEKVYSLELKLKNSLKFNIPNVKGLAVNSCYLALAYAGLKKEQLKGALKHMHHSGVILYRREQHVVCTVYEKVIDLSKSSNFKSIGDIGLNEKHLFVCDSDARTLYKFDLKSGDMIHSIVISDGRPNSIALNQYYALISDSLNSIVYAFDIDTLEHISTVKLKEIDQVNGNFGIIVTDDNLTFVKNSDNQICLLDSNLEVKAFFNEIQSKIINIALIKDATNQLLIVGCITDKQQFKLFGYEC